MVVDGQPLVSILTPIYNGEAYLRECIESVLAQTYSHWEYTIVNNCSKDGTLKIAEEYATRDKRIRVYDAREFVDIIANHNRAFRLISPDSKYCKVVSGDDWIFPECIERMVSLAETHPLVGIVGSYQLSGGGNKWYVRFHGLPYERTVISGREIGRSELLGLISVVGAPTSNMYRADLVRSREAFFPNSTAEADVSACFEQLKSVDFGFVHQILSYERLHEAQISTVSSDRNAYLSARIGDLLEYGQFYVTPAELKKRLNDLIDEYYAFLAISAANLRRGEFWSYHKKRLRDLGYPLDTVRLTRAIAAKAADLLLNPKQTVERMIRRADRN
jgi:glycosyltransferase involved in cell wall biosynthesis